MSGFARQERRPRREFGPAPGLLQIKPTPATKRSGRSGSKPWPSLAG